MYVCRYHFFHYLLHSPVMTDLHSLRLFVHTTLNSSHYFFKWSKGEENKRHWTLSLFLSLGVSFSFFFYLCIDQIFWSLFFILFYQSETQKKARKEIAVRTCAFIQLIKDVRTKKFLYIYTLETNKKWHTKATTDASRCVSWSEKDIVHVRRSTDGSFKNWLLPIRRRETSWIGSINL